MNIAPRNQAMTVFILALACSVLASFPVWGEWQARIVKDLRPGADKGTVLLRFVKARTLVYFVSNESIDGDYWLNRTDGTTAGTCKLCPLGYYHTASTDISSALATTGDQAVFARSNAGRLQLWRSDGTPEGTTELVDLGDPDDPQNGLGDFVSIGDQILFFGGSGSLYRSDGTVAGTFLVKDFVAGYGMWAGRKLCARNGLAYLIAGNAGGGDEELWCSDGTPGGTRRAWQPGTGYSISGLWSTPDGFYAAASQDYYDYGLLRQVGARELWRISPETGDKQRVFYMDNFDSGVYDLVWQNGQAFFSVLQKQQIWKTSGGADATMVAEVPTPPGLTYKPTIGGLAAVKGSLVFTAQTAAAGTELWTSDGTAGGTRLLKDFVPGPQSYDLTMLPLDGGDLFVCVREGMSMDRLLWKTDGTDAGTMQILSPVTSLTAGQVCPFDGGYLLPYSTPETGGELGFLYERPLAITQQPFSPGATEVNCAVRFTVKVSEWARPWARYQWLLNGSPIDGAIAPDLVIASAQIANTGLYTCRIVVNDGGGDTMLVSNAARLTVVEKLPVVNAPLKVVLSLLLCSAGGVAILRVPTRRRKLAAR